MQSYEDECARVCKFCAAGMPLSSAPRTHWTGNHNPPKCNAPSLAEFSEQQAARIAELEASLAIAKENAQRFRSVLAALRARLLSSWRKLKK